MPICTTYFIPVKIKAFLSILFYTPPSPPFTKKQNFVRNKKSFHKI